MKQVEQRPAAIPFLLSSVIRPWHSTTPLGRPPAGAGGTDRWTLPGEAQAGYGSSRSGRRKLFLQSAWAGGVVAPGYCIRDAADVASSPSHSSTPRRQCRISRPRFPACARSHSAIGRGAANLGAGGLIRPFGRPWSRIRDCRRPDGRRTGAGQASLATLRVTALQATLGGPRPVRRRSRRLSGASARRRETVLGVVAGRFAGLRRLAAICSCVGVEPFGDDLLGSCPARRRSSDRGEEVIACEGVN